MAQYLTTATEDHAENPGFTVTQLENYLGEIEIQPKWRPEADRSADYYDGKQLDAEYIQLFKDRGIAPIVFNHIAPAIDGVLGLEAKTRADWLVRADNEAGMEVAEALNEQLYEAAELINANRCCSDAFAAQAKVGLGWVEVNRNTNPFDYKYRANYVHRREIWWDWHSKRPDLKDARYLVRDRWIDQDQAILAFPNHANLVQHAFAGWHNWSSEADHGDYQELFHAYSDYSTSTLNEEIWRDTLRNMVRLYEVWYRVWRSGVALQLKDGKTVEYDPANRTHRIAVNMGQGTLVRGSFPEMRMAYYLGPHRVMDVPSPLPHDNFPYIPFWGFREDRTQIPYGLIRRMMSPQDEINARRSKMLWLLSAKRVIMDDDATDMTQDEVIDEVQRPDSLIVLRKDRMNRDANAFRVEQDFQLAAQQFEAMKDAEDAIHATSGVNRPMLGDAPADQSGIALSSQIEQSSTSLAELMDNFRYARQQVGEHILAMIVQDNGQQEQEVVVNANTPGRKTKHIKLNQRVIDERGVARINNDVTRTKTKVSLGDIQSTAGYRNQVFNRLSEILMTLPDELKAGMMDIVLEMADIPERDRLIKRMQELTGRGIDPNEMDEEERAAFEQQQQEAAAAKKQAFDHTQATIDNLKAKTAELNKKIESGQFEDAKTEAETEQILKEMQALTHEIGQMKADAAKQDKERSDARAAAVEAEGLLAQLGSMDSASGKAGRGSLLPGETPTPGQESA